MRKGIQALSAIMFGDCGDAFQDVIDDPLHLEEEIGAAAMTKEVQAPDRAVKGYARMRQHHLTTLIS